MSYNNKRYSCFINSLEGQKWAQRSVKFVLLYIIHHCVNVAAHSDSSTDCKNYIAVFILVDVSFNNIHERDVWICLIYGYVCFAVKCHIQATEQRLWFALMWPRTTKAPIFSFHTSKIDWSGNFRFIMTFSYYVAGL